MRVHSNERRSRTLKAAIIAVAAVSLAAISHVLAGGATPTWFALAGATLVALPITLALTRPSFGVSGTFAAVAITQTLFHWMFVFLGVRRTAQTGESLPAHCGFIGEFVPFVSPEHSEHAGMFTTHLIATVVTVWMLRRGEVALRRLARVLTRVLWPRRITVPAVSDRRTSLPVFRVDVPRVFFLVSQCVTRRGPPVALHPAIINVSHS